MRTYATVSPTFWTRGSGKRLRGDLEAQVVALYLVTSPHANMTGIFSLNLPTLCHETGLSLEGARKGLRRCSEEQIAFYDETEELAWVPAMARYQVGERLKVGKSGKVDKRAIGIKRALAPFKGHRFYGFFLERYGAAYCLEELIAEGASESLPRDYDPAPVLDPVGGAGGSDDPGRESVLPLDFELHPTSVDELAGALGHPREVILAAVQEFVSYWTIGGGMGKRRSLWQAKCRDDIRRKAETGKLDEIAKRIGAEPGKSSTRWVIGDNGEVSPA